MIWKYALDLFILADLINKLRFVARSAEPGQLDDEAITSIREQLDKMPDLCDKAGLDYSKKLLLLVLTEWDKRGVYDLHRRDLLGHLEERLRDELEAIWFKKLSNDEAEMYNATAPFGFKVNDKFPTAVEDIQEATKCLALDRLTASVFHLMRVMERGVQRLGRKLGVRLTAEMTWNEILNAASAKIKAMPRKIPAQKLKQERFSEIHAHLYHVKDAWRNTTMHPKKTYTERQTEAVFQHTRSFMMALAEII